MLALAFLVIWTLVQQQAKKQNFNPGLIFNLLFIMLISGIIGARIFYVVEDLSYYFKNPVEIIALRHGGLSWFGGLILAIICSGIYLRKKKIPVYKTFDLIAPFVAFGQAIGRIGCLLNGCCFGKASKFGIYFQVHNSVLIPTQIYSSLILIFIYIVLRLLQDRPHPEGKIFFTYLLLYSAKRFIIEFWRADNQIILLGLTLFQVISVIIFCLSFLKLLSITKSKN